MAFERCRYSGVVLCVSLSALAGCGRAEYPVAPVSGIVTCKGEAVKNASIIFSPIGSEDDLKPGKAANGELNDRGEFALSTFGTNDGAIIGKHRVTISFNEANPRLACRVPANLVREVKEGDNFFAIELDAHHKK